METCRRRSRGGGAASLPRETRSTQERTLDTKRRSIVDDTKPDSRMAKTEWGDRSRGVGLSFGKADHPTRPRQHLAWAHCATAEDDPTRLGHVSNHAPHPCQSLPSGRHRSQARRRSTGPRTRRESRCLYHCRLGSTSARRSSFGDDSLPNLKISVPTKASTFTTAIFPTGQAEARPCLRTRNSKI